MKQFSVKRKKYNFSHIISLILLAVVIIIFCISTDNAYKSDSEYEKKVLSNAVTKTVTQCYALEGEYPPDIKYLENYYGLTYNHERFFIDYDYIAGNLRPDITIIERK